MTVGWPPQIWTPPHNGLRFSRTRSERSVSAEALVGRVAEQSAMERVGGKRLSGKVHLP